MDAPVTDAALAGSRRRRPLWDTGERHAAVTAGRAVLILVVALLAVALPQDALERDVAQALGVCAAALGLHAALWLVVRDRPRGVRAAAEASLLVDAGWVLGLASASGGAGSDALWLLAVLTVGAALGYSRQLGVQAAVLAVVTTFGVRVLDDAPQMLSGDDVVRLGVLGALLATAIAGREVDARELTSRQRRLEELGRTSALFVASEDPAQLVRHAEAAAARLLPGWDVEVRVPAADPPPGGEDRAWRADGRSHLEVPLRSGGGRPPAGVIAASRPIRRGRARPRVRRTQVIAVHALASLLVEALRRAELVARLALLSRTDELTGLANRRGFDEALEAEIARARRSGQPLALVLLDIDRFKQLNDVHGHPAGDAVLAGLGRLLRDEVRGEDRACRFGGEEFALLLPGTGERDAVLAAERVRNAVERADLPHAVTVSLGVAIAAGDANAERLIAAADARLYAAKRLGRNRVVSGDAASAPAGVSTGR